MSLIPSVIVGDHGLSAREWDPFLDVIKWSLLVVNAISAIYLAIIFFRCIFVGQTRPGGRSFVFFFNVLIGFMVTIFGSYAAVAEDYTLLLMFGMLLMVNAVVATLVARDLIFVPNIGLYTVAIIHAFLESYLVYKRQHRAV